MARVHLIGTIHYELKGFERLERALQVEKPDIITLEASPEGLEDLIKHWSSDLETTLKLIKDRGFSQRVYDFFKEYFNSVRNFEYEVCKNYSERTGVPLYLIDDPNTTVRLRQEVISEFQTILNAINPEEVEKISRETIIKSQDNLYAYMQKLYDGEIPAIIGEKKFIDPLRGTFIKGRDEIEAKHIEELAKNYNGKIVHIGGCAHNLTDSRSETLYSRLKSLNPSRKTLWSYE